MPLPTAPRFEKRRHDVVRAGWRSVFALSGTHGPHYKDVVTGKRRGPEDPEKRSRSCAADEGGQASWA